MALPIMELEGRWEEIAARAQEFAGRRVKLIVLPEADQPGQRTRPTAADLLRMPAEQRSRILAQQAAALEEEYRTNPELTDFEAFGEDDLYDESPAHDSRK